MKNWIRTREEILNTELPVRTKSYSPIPHSVFLEEIQEELYKKNYSIAEERFLTANDCKVITGSFKIKSEEDTEMMPAISFVNSYNKMRKAEIRASALVLVCTNGMMGLVENGHYSRKHTTNGLEDFRNHISLVVDGLEKEFERLIINKQEMKQIELDKKTRALLVGDMLINEQLITATQLGIIQKEIQFSEHFKGDSLWSFYNHITEGYKENHAVNYDRQHVKFHTYISDKYNLTGSRGLYGKGLDISELAITQEWL